MYILNFSRRFACNNSNAWVVCRYKHLPSLKLNSFQTGNIKMFVKVINIFLINNKKTKKMSKDSYPKFY